MTHRAKDNLHTIMLLLTVLGFMYLWGAHMTFRFRHTWMTETQLMLHTKDAMLFHKVPRESVEPQSDSK